MLPGVEYWVFYGPGTGISPDNCGTGCQIITGAASGVVVSSPTSGGTAGYTIYGAPVGTASGLTGLTNGTPYSFSINGRYSGGPGGPGSPSVSTIPKFAGINWNGAASSIGTNDLHGVTGGTAIIAGGKVVVSGTGGGIYGSAFVAVGLNGALYNSPDASSWTAQTNPLPANHLYAVASFSPNYIATATTYVAVGQSGTILWSPDTITWTSYGYGTSQSPNIANNDLYAITSNGGNVYVAVGANGTIIYSGSNGTSWTNAVVPALPAGTHLYGVTYANFANGSIRYVAVGSAGTILSSPDGVNNWSVVVSPNSITSLDLKGVAFGASTIDYGVSAGTPTAAVITGVNTFVAVGNAGTLVTSLDNGLTWQLQTAITTGNLNAVTYARQFMAVGDGGQLFTSMSSTSSTAYSGTWTPQISGTTSPLYSVTHGRFDFTAVGGSGSPIPLAVSPAPGIGSGVNLHSM
jgi:hypothetical protein